MQSAHPHEWRSIPRTRSFLFIPAFRQPRFSADMSVKCPIRLAAHDMNLGSGPTRPGECFSKLQEHSALAMTLGSGDGICAVTDCAYRLQLRPMRDENRARFAAMKADVRVMELFPRACSGEEGKSQVDAKGWCDRMCATGCVRQDVCDGMVRIKQSPDAQNIDLRHCFTAVAGLGCGQRRAKDASLWLLNSGPSVPCSATAEQGTAGYLSSIRGGG